MNTAATAPRRAGDPFVAAVPEPFRILGMALKPLSLGRYRILQRHGCSFVADWPANASMEDLIFGVLVCSMRCDEFDKFLESKNRDKELKKWGKQIRKRIRKEKSFSMFEKFSLFRDYVNAESAIPQYWDETSGQQQPSGGHWSHGLETVLRSELHWTKEEIDESPMTKAIADYFKHAENKGMLRLINPDELLNGNNNASLLMAELERESDGT